MYFHVYMYMYVLHINHCLDFSFLPSIPPSSLLPDAIAKKEYCSVELTEAKYKAFVYAIRNHYWYQMYIGEWKCYDYTSWYAFVPTSNTPSNMFKLVKCHAWHYM